MFIDNDFPKILGAELYRPHPAYVAEMAVEPVVVHDFSRQPGQTVQQIDTSSGDHQVLRTLESVSPIKPLVQQTAVTLQRKRYL